jgi:hypothetical protein
VRRKRALNLDTNAAEAALRADAIRESEADFAVEGEFAPRVLPSWLAAP